MSLVVNYNFKFARVMLDEPTLVALVIQHYAFFVLPILIHYPDWAIKFVESPFGFHKVAISVEDLALAVLLILFPEALVVTTVLVIIGALA